MTSHEVDYADMQGLVRFGYKRMIKARYDLLRVKTPEAARSWLRSAPVTSAVYKDPAPRTALHVAFTAAGLDELGVPTEVIEAFSHEFRGGMVEKSRARQLGDVESNDPQYWHWGYGEKEPHLVVMFFGEPDYFDGSIRSAAGAEWTEAFETLDKLETTDLDGIEPFGFRDGISQPEIDWKQERRTPREEVDYSNIVALGEFLLGYRNEYGKITDRPLLEPDSATESLLEAIDEPGRKDLGRNGTYLVFRQLEQDVRGFWQFVRKHSGNNLGEAEQLASAMVGRNRAGDPLAAIQEKPIPGIDPKDEEQRLKNNFTFEQDPAGTLCPFGAHVRRANPRNTDFPNRPSGLSKLITMAGFGPGGFRDDLMSSARFHRILRRGREYGPELLPEDAVGEGPANEPKRGLHFICLNANISRQFEFLQNAWMMSTKFSGMTDESDPLLGNRAKVPGCPVVSDFNWPRAGGLRRRISGLPQFVTVRGGAYFFLPSLRALRYFANCSAK